MVTVISSFPDSGKNVSCSPSIMGLFQTYRKINDHSQNGAPSDFAIFFFFLLSVVPGLWHVFWCIFSTSHIRRNLRTQWRVRTTFDDVTFMYICPFYQINIYWVLRGQIFLSCVPDINQGYEFILGCLTYFGLSFYKEWALFSKCR